MALNKPIVGMAATPDGGGYWLVASDGGIFSYGDAQFYGSHGQHRAQQADRRHGRRRRTAGATGWWPPTAASSASATRSSTAARAACALNKPVVGMAATPGGNGLLAGGLRRRHLRFGDAGFYGSTGSLVLNKPIVGMITGPDGARVLPGGLRRRHLQLRHGTRSSARSAACPSSTRSWPRRPRPTDNGYWFTDTAGLVSNFGSANYYGSAPPNR